MSSPLIVFSDITLKCIFLKRHHFGNSVIIKAQKQSIGRSDHETHTLHPEQISYVQIVLPNHFHTTASSTCYMSFMLEVFLCFGMHVCVFQTSNL